jgi:lipoprotein-anchoring transpeptidase ErfK/SrfK
MRMLLVLGGLVASTLVFATGASTAFWMPDQPSYYYQPPIMAPQPSWSYGTPIYPALRTRRVYRHVPRTVRSHRHPRRLAVRAHRHIPRAAQNHGRPGKIVVRVSNSAQRMSVYVNGALAHSWPVSTARKGYRTPVGTYGVKRMERMWHSRKYDWSPMPHSLFFAGGYAIHGSYSVRQLGRPASHGCIRLAPGNAAKLYSLVRSSGSRNTRIVVTR